MAQIKICPQCETEYFAHITTCNDCSGKLLLPEEYEKLQEQRKQCREQILRQPVVVREGDLNWIDELYNVLIDSSIPCVVHVDRCCKKGCSSNPYQLLVSSADAEKATRLIEEHYMHVHPEFRQSHEMISEGKCPACGADVKQDTVQCPDCGLTLMIIE